MKRTVSRAIGGARSLGFEALEPRRLLAVVISELGGGDSDFLATRIRESASEPFGEAEITPDWIELANSSPAAIDLSGYHLTDDATDPFKWEIPSGTTLAGNGHIVFFASGEDVTDVSLDLAGFLHTSFSLDNGGEYLSLTDTQGQVVFEYAPKFSPLEKGYTLGLNAGGSTVYFANATPGEANDDASAVSGFVEDTKFSIDRGFYDAPMVVEVTSNTPGATIVYTVDGSEPTLTNGTQVAAPSSVTTPLASVNLSTTTVLRARAYLSGYAETNVDTHTYLFLNDVLQQSATPRGFPTAWGAAPFADYEMDPEIVDDVSYTQYLINGLRELPTLSIAGDVDDLFGVSGIYSNPLNDTLEAPASAELIYGDGAVAFQVDAGLKLQGGASREPDKSPKHSLSLRFRNQYGPGMLDYPLFEDSTVSSYDSIQLRAMFNNSWIHWDNDQRPRSTMIRDQYMRDSLLAMGQVDAGQGNYVHLYLDGLYWGVYNMSERPEASHYAEYFGGSEDDYDALNGGTPVDGDLASFHSMQSTVASGDWSAIQQVLDVDNFIDFNIMQRFAGNSDLKSDGNWKAVGGGPDDAPWRFYAWDSERILEGVTSTYVGPAHDPAGIYDQLLGLDEFRLRFADRIQQHFFNEGALTPANNVARFQARVDELQNAIVAESARWGDYRRDGHQLNCGCDLYDRDDYWQPEVDRLLNDYLPFRTDIVLDYYQSIGLYPDVVAPEFSQHGGAISSGFQLQIDTPLSTVTTETSFIEELQGDVTVWVPTSAVHDTLVGGAREWTLPEFDDAAWIVGVGAVGYDTGSGYTSFWGVDLLDPSLGELGIDTDNNLTPDNSSVYTRYEFNVDSDFDTGSVEDLLLRIGYDDGFIAYLNGIEILRVNAPSSPAWNSIATESHEASSSINALTEFSVSQYRNELLSGETNVLAIHGLNRSTTSSDFLISPELVYTIESAVTPAPTYYTTNGADPRLEGGAINSSDANLYTGPLTINNTTTVKARSLVNGEWSALTDATFTVANDVSNIVITELHYHPLNPSLEDEDDQEFIELFNAGNSAVDLSGLQITQFASEPYVIAEGVTLEAGEYLIVARNAPVFNSVYTADINVLSEGYAGRNLSNGGETVALADALGVEFFSFTYDDHAPWPEASDGDGPSLEIIDPLGDPSDPSNWRASAIIGGSPGSAGLAMPLIAGDYDGSGTVDTDDYGVWRSYFGQSLYTAGAGPDGNSDGRVDLADYVIWRNNLGASIAQLNSPASIESSGEPSVAAGVTASDAAFAMYQSPEIATVEDQSAPQFATNVTRSPSATPESPLVSHGKARSFPSPVVGHHDSEQHNNAEIAANLAIQWRKLSLF
ncbi:lamin tail domain-containing protein [Aeoliella sp. ICT_H6.2]|uniref:Lamin tail domain-containing protein n=1 Tax=Aeoliella straminimaris TaxID=2954799 RepID=A0A9X2F7B6_9BACT|nr:lamin tail domain-containing protein [Aeoliella straminimaris]MCO6043682.1 lamin tail domain-containing protein [Aeoliella straminimaris]